MERILGLDVGTRTIGVAVSDPLGITAQPVTTIRRTKLDADLAELRDIVALYNASLLVVGYPRNMNGTVGEQAQYVDRFVEVLRAQVPLPVELVDERLTTRVASQAMKAGNVKAARRKEIIDQQAAALILQGYMDRLSRQKKE
ncbi:putative Holliday junction resolvase [compost metagenome]|jgi:putative Holliday junction resolvase